MPRRWYARPSVGLLTAGLASLAFLVPGSSAAAGVRALQVGGMPLDGATVSTSATVTLVAPRTESVSWTLDGTYLGRDTAAPFQLALRTTAGSHKLKARSETSAGEKTTYEVRFMAVTGPAPAQPPMPVRPVLRPVPRPGPVQPDSGSVRVIRTSAELSDALGDARLGQVLQLADGTYTGRFVATASGTSSAPIVLRGGRRAILNGGSTSSGYALHLDGVHHWRLQGFAVRGGQKGIVLDRSNLNVLSGLDVGSTGMEAVHFRSASSDNRLEGSAVHDTGLFKPGYGEGVYIGSAKSHWSKYGNGGPDRSDRNTVVGNRIWGTRAENIDVKEGTTGGLISGNFFDGSAMTGGDHFADSWIDLKGNRYRVLGNTGVNTPLDGFQTHVQLDGWGRSNVFSGNVLQVNAAGYGVNVYQPADTDNVVRCDNVVTRAGRGLANFRCS